MELRDYLNVIARRKWIIAGATLMVVAAALLISLLQRPLYESRVTILADINRAAGQSTTQALYSLAFGDPDTFIQTQAEIIKTRTLAEAVHSRLEYQYQEAEYDRREGKEVFVPASIPSPEEMLERVKVDRTQNTNVFRILFADHDPLLARDISQAYADE